MRLYEELCEQRGELPVEPRWDGQLLAAMKERGHAVHEEQILDILLDDLKGD